MVTQAVLGTVGVAGAGPPFSIGSPGWFANGWRTRTGGGRHAAGGGGHGWRKARRGRPKQDTQPKKTTKEEWDSRVVSQQNFWIVEHPLVAFTHFLHHPCGAIVPETSIHLYSSMRRPGEDGTYVNVAAPASGLLSDAS